MGRVINPDFAAAFRALRIYARHLCAAHPENFRLIIRPDFRIIISNMKSLINLTVFLAKFVQPGQIKYTCEQAELYCSDGIFIQPENVCETYPDEIGLQKYFNGEITQKLGKNTY